jgi:hypothetical protein
MNESFLETRINALERQVKFQRWAIGGLLLAALAVGGIAASTSDVSNEIKTKRLTVVSEKGGNSIMLATEKNGGVILLFGGDGLNPQAALGCREEGGELLIKGGGGQNRVQISGEKDSGKIAVWSGGQMRDLSPAGSK